MIFNIFVVLLSLFTTSISTSSIASEKQNPPDNQVDLKGLEMALIVSCESGIKKNCHRLALMYEGEPVNGSVFNIDYEKAMYFRSLSMSDRN